MTEDEISYEEYLGASTQNTNPSESLGGLMPDFYARLEKHSSRMLRQSFGPNFVQQASSMVGKEELKQAIERRKSIINDPNEDMGQEREPIIVPREGANISTVICNHLGFTEGFNLLLCPLHPSFAAKDSLRKLPIFGKLCEGHQTLFVNRAGTAEERKKLVETIMERQIAIEDAGRRLNPICIFPEGTTTNGQYLMPFKRGAFQAMRTIRPCFIKLNFWMTVRPSFEGPELFDMFVLLLSNFGFTLATLYIMPPFIPNQYMLDTHGDKGEADWEIYAWCLRDVMAKAGKFELSNVGHRERLDYSNFMNKRINELTVNGKTYTASD